MSGHGFLPYCLTYQHPIICARELSWAIRERSPSLLTSILPRISLFLTPAEIWGAIGGWAVGFLSTPLTPQAMTASSGHPDRRRGARSFTFMFLYSVTSSFIYHQSGHVWQGFPHFVNTIACRHRVTTMCWTALKVHPATWWIKLCCATYCHIGLCRLLLPASPWHCILPSTLQHRRRIPPC